MIALNDASFLQDYQSLSGGDDFAGAIIKAIRDVLANSGLSSDKIETIIQSYNFISTHPELIKDNTLYKLLEIIEQGVYDRMSLEGIDVVGEFYTEFLRYTGGEKKGLGIVLTPQHITKLFCDLAQLTVDSVVFDPCCGTGGLLIAAMNDMVAKANGDEDVIAKIKEHSLIGIEQAPNVFTLAVGNMVLRGGGKANLIQGSCFGYSEAVKTLKPTVGMVNPPHSQKGGSLSELDFVRFMLDCLEKGGTGLAIVPTSCALQSWPELKKAILAKHTLVAAMSMPECLFYPVQSVPTLLVFKAHHAHDSTKPSWFGYWKDDGYAKSKAAGRVDSVNLYPEIRRAWLEGFMESKTVPGLSISACVSYGDEWCAEAYLETDYSDIIKASFYNTAKEFKLYKLKQECVPPDCGTPIDTSMWKIFMYSDLFAITGGQDAAPKEAKGGDCPVIGASVRDNGFRYYTDVKPNNTGGKITVANTGAGGVGVAFYQDEPFFATGTVNVLTPNFSMTPGIGLFLASLITKERYKYSFGRILALGRLSSSEIHLPATAKGRPDWRWVEKFMSALPRLPMDP